LYDIGDQSGTFCNPRAYTKWSSRISDKKDQINSATITAELLIAYLLLGHAVLHAAALIQLRPSTINEASPLAMSRGTIPSISHLWRFGCVVYVQIPPP